VIVADHLSVGKRQILASFFSHENFEFIEFDLLDDSKLKQAVNKCQLIFHLAGNSIVQTGHRNPEIDFFNNIVVTRNVLENMRTSDFCKKNYLYVHFSNIW
jgi:UDP-glucose 4-epimerase